MNIASNPQINYVSGQEIALNNAQTVISRSFAGNDAKLTTAQFYLAKMGTPTGNAVAKLYACTGSAGSVIPTGSALATSSNFDVSLLTTTIALATFTFAGTYQMKEGTNYCIVLQYTGTATDYIISGTSTTLRNDGNAAIYTSTWTASSTLDLIFYVNGNYSGYSAPHILMNYLQNGSLTGINAYFLHDPLQIPFSMMPAIVVELDKSSDDVGPTGIDVDTQICTIKVIFNKKDDFGSSLSTDTTREKIRKMVEARDPSTGLYLSNTIKSILRTNLTLGNYAFYQISDANYGITPRPNDILAEECHIQVTISQHIYINSRV